MRAHSLVIAAILATVSPSAASPAAKPVQWPTILNLPNPHSPFNLAAGNNNNYNLDGSYTVVDLVANASGSTITGLNRLQHLDGDSVILRNHSASLPITLSNEDTNSTAGNRFIFPGALSIVLQPRESLWVARNLNADGYVPIYYFRATSATSKNTAPGRSFNTTYKPSATQDVLLTYSVRIQTGLTLAAGAAGRVDLMCDNNTTPTTVVATVQQGSTGTLTIGLNLQSSNTLVIHYRAMRNENCRMVTTNETGTATFTLVAQVEQPVG